MGITVTLTDIEQMEPRSVSLVAKFLTDLAKCTPEVKQAAADADDEMEHWQPEPEVVVPVPPPPPAKTESGIEVDADGFPWDGRIHAASRGKNADGTWRNRRGIENDFKNAVERELKITMGIPVIEFAKSIIPPPPAEVPPPPFVNSVAAFAPPEPEVITPPESDGVVIGASHNSSITFPQLMMEITKGFAAKTISQSDIQAAIAEVGLPSLPMLASRPDLVPAVADALGIPL